MTRSRRRNTSPRAYQSQHERIEALEKSWDHWRRRAREAEQKPTISGPPPGGVLTAVRIDPRTMLGSVTYSQPDCPHCHESEQSAIWWRRIAGYSVAACGLILAAAAVFW